MFINITLMTEQESNELQKSYTKEVLANMIKVIF